jgi:hypothetical protein
MLNGLSCGTLLYLIFNLVRTRGLEPPQPYGHYHLKVARLPIPPRPHEITLLSYDFLAKNSIAKCLGSRQMASKMFECVTRAQQASDCIWVGVYFHFGVQDIIRVKNLFNFYEKFVYVLAV